jgi:hypothetical protein
MKLRGSFVEWSSAVQLHLVHHGRGITATWNPQTGKTNVQIAMRHQFASRQKTKLLAKVEQPTSWLDINYTFAGAPPSVELQLRGVQTHRVVLIAQNRQWKDHVPPGRYAVVGNSPNGWKLELPNDSITLHPGQTSSIWVSLKPKVSNIRWATGPSESPESGNP